MADYRVYLVKDPYEISPNVLDYLGTIEMNPRRPSNPCHLFSEVQKLQEQVSDFKITFDHRDLFICIYPLWKNVPERYVSPER